MVLVSDDAQVEAHFGLFRDSANLDTDGCKVCAKHTIGSEIILDVPDASPKSRGSNGCLFWSIWR